MATHYIIAEETSAYMLAMKVQDLLEQGWKLQGGISIALSPRTVNYIEKMVYCQALTKEGISA